MRTFIIMWNRWRNEDKPSIKVDLNCFFRRLNSIVLLIYFSCKRGGFLNSASRHSTFSKEIQNCEPFVLMNSQMKCKNQSLLRIHAKQSGSHSDGSNVASSFRFKYSTTMGGWSCLHTRRWKWRSLKKKHKLYAHFSHIHTYIYTY